MKKKSAGSVAIMLLVMIYLLIPLVISIIYSVFHKWTGVIPEGFTLHNYVDLFMDSNFLASVGRSIAMSIIPIIVTIVIVLLALFVTAIYFPKLEKYVQIICMIPYTFSQYPVSVCRFQFDSEQPSGHADGCVLYRDSAIYLSGYPKRYACGEYADTDRGSGDAWCIQDLCIFQSCRTEYSFSDYCIVTSGSRHYLR